MKEIKLTKGKVALVDDADFDYLNQWSWCTQKCAKTSYAIRSIYSRVGGKRIKKTIRMHRIILSPLDGMEVDHINHNGLDNRRCNIRVVTRRGNMSNRTGRAGLLGVYRNGNGYMSRIKIDKKEYYLGQFRTKQQARAAYINACDKYLKNQI